MPLIFGLHGCTDAPEWGGLLTHRNLLSTEQAIAFLTMLRRRGTVTSILDYDPTHDHSDTSVVIVDDATRAALPILEWCDQQCIPVALAVNAAPATTGLPHWWARLDAYLDAAYPGSACYRDKLDIRRRFKATAITNGLGITPIEELLAHLRRSLLGDTRPAAHPQESQPLSLDDLRGLSARGVVLLPHGTNHVHVVHRSQVDSEILACKSFVEQITNRQVDYWVTPFGLQPCEEVDRTLTEITALTGHGQTDANLSSHAIDRIIIGRSSTWLRQSG